VGLPSIESLRCFDAAARLLRFRAAAKAVALTPAALGHRIRQLEDDLGVKLFERTTRTVRLTAAGLAVLPYARACLEAASSCGRAAKGEIGPAPVEILVGTRHELGISWLTPSLKTIEEQHPGLTVHLYFGSGPDLMLRVRTLEIDCAVTSSRLSDPSLEALPIHEEHYVFVASPKLLRTKPLRRSEDARSHTLVDASPEVPLFSYWRDAAGGGDRLSFRHVMRIGTIGAIRELVLAGEGVAVLPVYLVHDDLRTKRLVKVFPRVTPIHDWFRLIYRRDDPRAPVYQTLANTLMTIPLR
jgi:LysR family transcriptional regulator, glycine cleavage system transcriptional activator